MPDMPMPPMPTKWMVPMESGSALMPLCSDHAQHHAPPAASRGIRPPSLRRRSRRHLSNVSGLHQYTFNLIRQPAASARPGPTATRAPGCRQRIGIGALMIIDRIRQRDENRRPPDHRNLRHRRTRRRARSPDARLPAVLRHIGEKTATARRQSRHACNTAARRRLLLARRHCCVTRSRARNSAGSSASAAGINVPKTFAPSEPPSTSSLIRSPGGT